MIVNSQQGLVVTTSRCQKLLERIPHLAWLMTEQGEVAIGNQRWCEYVGESGVNYQLLFAAIVPVVELERWSFAWTEARRSQQTLEIQLQLKSKSGDLEWFQVELAPDCDESGQTIWIGTAIGLGDEIVVADTRQSIAQLSHTQIYYERLLTAMRMAKAAAWHWDLINQEIHWTPEFERLFDYEPSSTAQVYSEWLDRVHIEDRTAVEGKLQKTIDLQLAEFRNEYRIIWRDGQIRWIEMVGELHCDEQGKVQWISGLVYDITDRKHNEEALRHSEEFVRRVLESNQDCIKVMDLAGHILYMNDGGQVLMEIDDFATIANTQWLTFWQCSEFKAAESAFATAAAGGIGRFEGYCPTAKSTPKWWEVVVTAIRDADDRVEQILSVSSDITARKQAEIDLQASEELFRHTFEEIPMGFCHVALDGTWLRVNRKFCEIVGYTQAELCATTFQAITEPADLDRDFAFIEHLFSSEHHEGTLEKRYIHKQGHHVWVNLTASLIGATDIDGQSSTPQYFLCAIEDISVRKQLELLNTSQTAELERLNNSLMLAQHKLSERNEDLNAFGYIVSHDLKAPLRAIANLSEWIEEDLNYRLLENDREQFQLLRQRVKRMDALIDGLLQYSRLGRLELEIETVDVAQLLAETIDSLPIPLGFEIEILPPLPTLTTKRILLSQVFANLLSNAIKHHDRADGRVEISAEDLGDRYRFAIADDGPGIPAGAARERIFEIFQTLKPSVSSANTGIGLALVKKIVESEGGQIWVDADRSAGACFYFTWLKSVDG